MRVQMKLTNIGQFVRDRPTRIRQVISYHNLIPFSISSAFIKRFLNRNSAWSDKEKGHGEDYII